MNTISRELKGHIKTLNEGFSGRFHTIITLCPDCGSARILGHDYASEERISVFHPRKGKGMWRGMIGGCPTCCYANGHFLDANSCKIPIEAETAP